jgi:sec-independent protein translocase protein TatC
MFKDKPKTVIGHLDELRKRVITCILSFLILISVLLLIPSFDNSLANKTLKHLQQEFVGKYSKALGYETEIKLIFLDPIEPIFTSMKMAGLMAVLLLLPLFLYQIFAFLAPAFTATNQKLMFWFVVLSIVLLIAGIVNAYLFMVPITFKVLLGYGINTGAVPQLAIGKFFNFVLWMFVVFAVPFELPLVIGTLSYAGIVSTGFLRKIRKTAYVAISIFSAVATPDPTPVSMLILAACLIVLYEVGFLISFFFKKKKNIAAKPKSIKKRKKK